VGLKHGGAIVVLVNRRRECFSVSNSIYAKNWKIW